VDDVRVIADPDAAGVALDEVRARMLAELREPRSATQLAARLGLPRQRANYHLRELERRGLVRFVSERRKRNMNERLYEAAAASFVISPAALAAVAPDPSTSPDRLSAGWLVALGSRLVAEVGELLARSQRTGRPVATLGVDADLTFATAADRAGFSAELTEAIDALIAKYHASSTWGRAHRLVVALHPRPDRSPTEREGG
jgi:DNA-binding transcriptional ArsR family regulator